MEFTYRVSGRRIPGSHPTPEPPISPTGIRAKAWVWLGGRFVLCAFIDRRGLIKAHSVDKD